MGVSQSKCVNLKGLDDSYFEDAYTVIRTSGERQEGWRMSKRVHICYLHRVGSWRPSAHAWLEKDGWRIYMHNGDQEDAEGKIVNTHVCGWRPIGGFWPTRLTGDEAAIATWSAELKALVDCFAEEQGLPTYYAEHTCSKGAPRDYCDGCCAERRALEKKAAMTQPQPSAEPAPAAPLPSSDTEEAPAPSHTTPAEEPSEIPASEYR